MFKRPMLLIIPVVVALAVTLVAGMLLTQRNKTTIPNAANANSEDVAEMLNRLEVHEESDLDYPENFGGAGWRQKDYCKTDALVLKIESKSETKSIPGNCKPVTGDWYSPYDGKTWTQSSKLEIDHMVPKREAWQSGASDWTDSRRKSFKNDRTYAPSLIAVTEHENASKQDEEPGFEKRDYLPPLVSYRCTYVAEWIAVKWRWSLSVDSAEKANLQRILNSCVGKIEIPRPTQAKIDLSVIGI